MNLIESTPQEVRGCAAGAAICGLSYAYAKQRSPSKLKLVVVKHEQCAVCGYCVAHSTATIKYVSIMAEIITAVWAVPSGKRHRPVSWFLSVHLQASPSRTQLRNRASLNDSDL